MKHSTFALFFSLLTLVAVAHSVGAAEPTARKLTQSAEISSPARTTEPNLRSPATQSQPRSETRLDNRQVASPSPGIQEATQTCDGFIACLDTLSFCDGVGGGMSSNPDGSYTCTY